MYTRNRPPGAYLRRRVRVHACKADKRKVSVLSDEMRPRPVRGVGMKSEFDNLGDVLADRHTVTRSTSASDDNLRGPHPRHGLTPCQLYGPRASSSYADPCTAHHMHRLTPTSVRNPRALCFYAWVSIPFRKFPQFAFAHPTGAMVFFFFDRAKKN